MARATDAQLSNPAFVLSSMLNGNDYCPNLITASINAINGAGKKLDARIHATACAIVSRANGDSRDASRMSCLVNVMPKSGRRKALVAWFHHYTNFRLVEGKDGLYAPAKQVKIDGPMFRKELPADPFSNPFWTAKEKDTDPSAFDTDALARRVASIIKAAKADTARLDDAGKAALADLQVLAIKLAPAA